MVGLLFLILAHYAGKHHEPSDFEKRVVVDTERWLGVFMPFTLLAVAIVLLLYLVGVLPR